MRARRADARRNIDAIVEAAARTLAEEPRAAMQDIARAAGLHRATVHRHFATRDDLIDAVRKRAIESAADALQDVVRTTGDASGVVLERYVQAMLEVGDRYRLYRYTTWQDSASERHVEPMADPILKLLAAARADGHLRTDLPLEYLGRAVGGLSWSTLPAIADGSMTIGEATRSILTMLAPPAR